MRFASNLFNAIAEAWKRTDPSSLQFRLTAGVVAFSVLGLGSVALWTSWKLQQILIDSHKQNVLDVAERFPQDVEVKAVDPDAVAADEMWSFVEKTKSTACLMNSQPETAGSP